MGASFCIHCTLPVPDLQGNCNKFAKYIDVRVFANYNILIKFAKV